MALSCRGLCPGFRLADAPGGPRGSCRAALKRRFWVFQGPRGGRGKPKERASPRRARGPPEPLPWPGAAPAPGKGVDRVGPRVGGDSLAPQLPNSGCRMRCVALLLLRAPSGPQGCSLWSGISNGPFYKEMVTHLYRERWLLKTELSGSGWKSTDCSPA